jgi:GNAT superfamily N-acetyltransferase
MRIEPLDFADTETMLACHRVYLAAHDTDAPDGPWFGARAFGGWMRTAWYGEPREIWTARTPDGVTGWYRLLLPVRENRHRASLELIVHPEQRRRGTGRVLLRHAVQRAIACGRSTLAGNSPEGSPGEAFARAAGARDGLTGVSRVQNLKALPPLDGLRAVAGQAAAGYRLVSWSGVVPDTYLDGVAAVFNALGDAPRSAGSQPQVWDAQRVREDFNDLSPEYAQRGYSIAALAATSGEMAALTQVFVDPEVPAWGMQGMTAVARPHRGHRLGLLVKLAMLDLLAQAEPGLERIATDNAESNDHMIAVNEAIGYRTSGPPFTRWKFDLPPGSGSG